jgi:hypothetical protein
VTRFDIIGGDVPDQALRVDRVISADDPDDLNSPLRYSVTVEQVEDGDGEAGVPPAKRKLAEALAALPPGEYAPADALVDWIKGRHGHGLGRQTMSRYLNGLSREGKADHLGPRGRGRRWATPQLSPTVAKPSPATATQNCLSPSPPPEGWRQ